jgi:hypothetical protein
MNGPRRLCARLLAALFATGMVLAGGTARPAAANQLGTYEGNGTTGRAHIPDFETWLGRPLSRALDFVSYGSSWSNLVSSAVYVANAWDGSRWRLSISVPMLPADGHSSLSQGATGAYNTYFKQIATTLVGHGLGASIIRLGWEFNGSWYPWAAYRCPTCFVQFWQQIVTTMRAVPGAQFKFDWCPDIGYQMTAADKVYPGDAYVDVIGLDVYNQSPDPTMTPQARWSYLMNQNFGLKWQAAFAGGHHKYLSFPEWATGVWTGKPGIGGGDDPYFIQQMHDWMKSQWNFSYHNYFDVNGSYKGKISTDQYPNAGALFRTLFLPEQ